MAGATPIYTTENYGGVQSAPHQKAQQELLQLAETAPQSEVQVIVQKAIHGSEVEQWVMKKGGEILQDLSIINAFAARMPAANLPELAMLDAVRWISLDGPVASTSNSKNNYYLHNSSSDGDTVAQAILPLDRSVPLAPVLYNLDNGRDQAPGLSLLPGGNVNSSAEGQIQRWRMTPFATEVQVDGTISLRLYAAVMNFQRVTNKITAHLVRIGTNGQPSGVIASTSLERKWSGQWHRATLKFEVAGLTFKPGEQLEVAVTNNGPETMWLAFGSHQYPSHLKAVIKDALTAIDYLYLANDPALGTGDTASRPVLPFIYTEPKEILLPNYDTNRDSQPGLLLMRGATSQANATSSQVQRWRLATFTADTQLAPNAEVEVYAAVKGFQKQKSAKLWAYLNEVDANGNGVRVIASGFYTASDWGDKFAARKISFKNAISVLHAGNQLELAVMVDNSSADDLWLAYNTKAYPSRVKTNFWSLLPYTLLDTIDAPEVWAQGLEGQGIRVAVIDSGIWKESPDFIDESAKGTVRRLIHYFGISMNEDDKYGHGSFIASVIAGNGTSSGGYYKGVAPKADIISVRVSNEWGSASESDVVAGMQWVLQNKAAYNIRVVNLSLNSAVAQPYGQSPLNAAAEILWFNGLVVVTSGGNNGMKTPGVVFPPANDPFVIAVGASEEMETGDPADDILAGFSAYGITPDGYSRPDVVAPGSSIVSTLAEHSRFKSDYLNNHGSAMNGSGQIEVKQFVASGTSISAGAVSGAAALLLQALPGLNPDQVKYLLMASATPVRGTTGAGAGQINIARAIALGKSYGNVSAVPAANSGLPISQLLYTGSDPVQWNSVNWNSVNWNSVNWNSVNWNSVNWNSMDNGGGTGVDSQGGQPIQTPLVLDEDEVPADDAQQTEPSEHMYLPMLER
jgi:serine protease AprX